MAKAGNTFTKILIYVFSIVSLIATVIVGILSAIAAQKIADSNTKSDDSGRTQAIVAAILAIIASVAMVGVFIASLYLTGKDTKKVKAEKK